jgi:cold shock CspA family protein
VKIAVIIMGRDRRWRNGRQSLYQRHPAALWGAELMPTYRYRKFVGPAHRTESTSSAAKREKIKFYLKERGFDFVVPDDSSGDLFFHYGAVIGREPDRDDQVLYVAAVRNGKRAAIEVKVL